jgi:hypothetical protein
MKPIVLKKPNLTELKERLRTSTEIENVELALANYEMFFCLLKLNPTLKAVPTKSIDTIWHYHLSLPSLYKSDCLNYFGHIVGHNPAKTKKEKLRLKANYKKTSELWFSTFQLKYGDKNEMAICGVDGGDDGGDNGGNDY